MIWIFCVINLFLRSFEVKRTKSLVKNSIWLECPWKFYLRHWLGSCRVDSLVLWGFPTGRQFHVLIRQSCFTFPPSCSVFDALVVLWCGVFRRSWFASSVHNWFPPLPAGRQVLAMTVVIDFRKLTSNLMPLIWYLNIDFQHDRAVVRTSDVRKMSKINYFVRQMLGHAGVVESPAYVVWLRTCSVWSSSVLVSSRGIQMSEDIQESVG